MWPALRGTIPWRQSGIDLFDIELGVIIDNGSCGSGGWCATRSVGGEKGKGGRGGWVGGRGLFGARINTVIESCLTGSEGRRGEGGMQSEREASSQ